MTAPRALVAYASKNGGTAEIARWIAEELEGRGVLADAAPAASVDRLDGYDLVVLGSGLYAGRWLRAATRFGRRHRARLLRMPVWLFSSGPLDASPAGDVPPVPGAARLVDRIDACDHTTFGGRLDENARGFVARQILAQGRGGDFRDRDRVRAWADVIAADALAAEAVGPRQPV